MAKYYFFKHVLGDFYFNGDFNIIKPTPEIKKEARAVPLDKIPLALSKVPFDYNVIFDAAKLDTKKKLDDSVTDDILVIQAVNAIDELNKTINLLSKRLREWSLLIGSKLHYQVNNNERFVRELLDFINDSDNVNLKNNEASRRKTEMLKISSVDLAPIKLFAEVLLEKYRLKDNLTEYIKSTIKKLCPNTSKYLGEILCARLIAAAGSFKRLVFYPASTIQLLGAEKALFRHLKDKRHKSPKYGLLFQHPIMSKLKQKERGKAARILANFAAKALKLDFVSGKINVEKLKIIAKQVESLYSIV